MSIFLGKNISLRALEPEDLDFLYSWENNTDIWNLGNTLKPYSRETLKKYLATAHLDIYETNQIRFAIVENKDSSEPVGLIDLFDFDPHHQRAGVGILLGSHKNRGKGYGYEALTILCEYAFNILHLHQLFCSIPEDNQASLGLFKKSGFIKTGSRPDWIKSKEGWKDEIFFQLSEDTWLSSIE